MKRGAGRARGPLVAASRAALLVVCALAPGQAWALCPNCLGQARHLTPTLELLGGFLLVPFVVFYLGLRAIRRACRAAPIAPGPSGPR